MDPTTAAAFIQGLKSLFDVSSKIRDNGLKTEMQSKISAVQIDCMELQQRLILAQAEIEEKNKEIAALEARADIRGKLKHKNGYYILNDDLGEREICSACWEVKEKTVPLKKHHRGAAKCPNCKAIYLDVFPYTPPMPYVPPRRRGPMDGIL